MTRAATEQAAALPYIDAEPMQLELERLAGQNKVRASPPRVLPGT